MSKISGKPVARLSDLSHPSREPAVTGSKYVLVNSRPVLRENDSGVGGWRAIEGAPFVLVNGKRIHRLWDRHSASAQGSASANTLAGNYGVFSQPAGEILPPEIEMLVFCKHPPSPESSAHRYAKPEHRLFEVVPQQGELYDTVRVLYKDTTVPPPETITVSSSKSTQVVKTGPKERKLFNSYSFDVACDDPLQYSIFSKEFWRFATIYHVDGLRTGLDIKVYPPHRWKFEIKFPALAGVKMGSKYQKNLVQKPNSIIPKTEGNYGKEAIKEYNSWKPWTLQKTTRAGEDIAQPQTATKVNESFSLTKDGVTVGDPNQHAIFSIIFLLKDIFSITNKIQDMVPKIGWYFESTINLLQGAFTVEWQWREFHDHRVFLWLACAIDINIIEVKLEFGFGFEGFGCKAQLFVNLAGSMGVQISAEHDTPDIPPYLKLPFKRSIVATIGARVEAGDAFKIELALNAGFTFSGHCILDITKGASIESDVQWDGIKGKITISGELWGLTGEYQREAELFEGTRLGKCVWPSPDLPIPQDVDRESIKHIMYNKFTEGYDVRVNIPSNSLLRRDEVKDAWYAADEVAKIVDSRLDIRRDAKSIEALAHDIRQRLDERRGFKYTRGYFVVEHSVFISFLSELDSILTDNYLDQIKTVRTQLGLNSNGNG